MKNPVVSPLPEIEANDRIRMLKDMRFSHLYGTMLKRC